MRAGPSIAQRKMPPTSIFGGDIPSVLYADPALGGDGKTRLNPDKSLAKWYWIMASQNGKSPMLLKALQTLTMDLTVRDTGDEDKGDFEATTLNMRAFINGTTTTGLVAVRPRVNSPTCNRFLSNVPIPHPLISGTSQLPGVLRMGVYCLPNTNWSFQVQELAGFDTNVEIVLHGRQFDNCTPCASNELRARAQHLQWFHPYWIGPQDPNTPSLTGPQFDLSAGQSQIVTFPVPSDADFLMFGLLDDSFSSVAQPAFPAPLLTAQIQQNDSQRGLIDLSGTIPAATAATSQLGISWQDFVAIPTPSVVGPVNQQINAYSLAPGLGGWTHLVPRNTQIVIRFTNPTANQVVVQPALFGMLVYGRQPENRQTSIDGAAERERVAQGQEFLRRMGLTSEFAPGGAS